MKSVRALFRTNKEFMPSIQVLRYSSWSDEQNEIFNQEVEKQRKKIGRIEKINVSYHGKPNNALVSLNKHISTPYDVAKHVSEWLTRDGVLGLVDNEEPWDMHRPLDRDCNLRILTFSDNNNHKLLNRVFWKSCSFMLGSVIQSAFKENLRVTLHSFPSPRITSGSFVYDAHIEGLETWSPNTDELRTLSTDFVKLAHSALPIERLRVSQSLAQQIFQRNQFKVNQIPDIASNSENGEVCLYRVGSHIDISKGPMMANTNFIGRASICAVHKVENDGVSLLRFQGVALPRGIMLNHFAYKILEDRAKKLNNFEQYENYDSRETRARIKS